MQDQGQQQKQSGPPPDDSAGRFLDILNNRGKHETDRSDLPVRRQGFTVLARDGFDLWPLQALCGKSNQSWNDCLTARYRLRRGAIFGTLLAAFLADLQKIRQGKTDDLAGVFFPGAAEPDWREFLQRWSKNVPTESGLGDIGGLAPEQFEGRLARRQLNDLLKVLSLEEVLPQQKRLVLFAEVYEGEPDAGEQEWKMAKTILLDRLPERVGLVFSGAPTAFELEDVPHFLELSLSRIGAFHKVLLSPPTPPSYPTARIVSKTLRPGPMDQDTPCVGPGLCGLPRTLDF
jgi:hypothetical protein